MRTYVWRYKCPRCGRPYAKKVLWMRHIKGCSGTYRTDWVLTDRGYR